MQKFSDVRMSVAHDPLATSLEVLPRYSLHFYFMKIFTDFIFCFLQDDSFPCIRPNCSGRFRLVRHVSFVDCPGHDILMATMLNGAAVMDAALLLIGITRVVDFFRKKLTLKIFAAGNESCPQPQTSEHLAAIEIMKLKHILILQNKIDLVKESQAKEQYDQIEKFVQGISQTQCH